MTTLTKEQSHYDYNETTLLRAYFKEPNLENAHALLRTLLRAPINESLKRKHDSTPTASTQSKRGGAAPLSHDVMDAIIYTDTLHDLNFSVKQWIFNHVNPAIISPQTIHKATVTIDIGNAFKIIKLPKLLL